jgi:uncharacterized protein YkwD
MSVVQQETIEALLQSLSRRDVHIVRSTARSDMTDVTAIMEAVRKSAQWVGHIAVLNRWWNDRLSYWWLVLRLFFARVRSDERLLLIVIDKDRFSAWRWICNNIRKQRCDVHFLFFDSVERSRELLGDYLISEINAVRQSDGLPTLRRNTRLDESARLHADELAGTGVLRHRGRDGSTPATRAWRAGYDRERCTENILMGSCEASAMVPLWLKSKGHRRNILDAEACDVGIACSFHQGADQASGTMTCVAVFGGGGMRPWSVGRQAGIGVAKFARNLLRTFKAGGR